jgi:hypothetical protein
MAALLVHAAVRCDSFIPGNYRLSLVAQPLLMTIRLHALLALVLGDLCFSTLFDGTHSYLERFWKQENRVLVNACQ